MRRRISALVLTAVMAGTGAALVTAPTAQAASSTTCDIAKLRHDADVLYDKAARQKRAGQREAARRTIAQADALKKRAAQCDAADRNVSHHF
ncbi:hypothetical protein [Streptomyces sp. UNOB3_S3]|uniref:hypothetical protein n=1 Tax=Streptomyces sp. UNOB3_S3 TaxID=2871682 RepID=UPI001E5CC136|nr:hypothetical protein [Streptomyces sp. UNOB3_S3]MCC3774453.1 hypothetical protein [Streptomyces sp. UNOB3_S3]